MPYIGELAAVITSLCFSVNSVLVTLSGHHLGAVLVNRVAVILSCIFVFIVNWITSGQPFPVDATPERWLILGISGIAGYWLAFLVVIQSFLYIGPRLSLLVGSIAPVLSAILAWLLLGEILETVDIIGILVTIAGIVFVVAAKAENGMAQNGRDYRLGVTLALVGAVLRASVQVLMKVGLADDFPAITGSFMRILPAMIAMLIYMVLRGEIGRDIRLLRDHRRASGQASFAALIGPGIGATIFAFAIQQTEVGVASTLGNMGPIFLIPIGYFVFKERITRRAVIGTIIAFIGTAILFWA